MLLQEPALEPLGKGVGMLWLPLGVAKLLQRSRGGSQGGLKLGAGCQVCWVGGELQEVLRLEEGLRRSLHRHSEGETGAGETCCQQTCSM